MKSIIKNTAKSGKNFVTDLKRAMRQEGINHKYAYFKFARLARKHGVVNFQIDRIASSYTEDYFESAIGKSDKKWAYEHGFASFKFNWYGLNRNNYQNYISDFDFYNERNYMSRMFVNWFDHKLNTYYLLRPFKEYMPRHYWYLKYGQVFPIDVEAKGNASTEDIINLIKSKPIAAKACLGGHGRGFYKFEYNDGKFFCNQDMMSEDVLRNLLSSLNEYLIEDYVVPHSVFRKMCGADAFAVMRIVTVYSNTEGPQVPVAIIRLGTKAGGLVTDHEGTINVGINLQTGELFNPKYRYGKTSVIHHKDIETHPDTGEMISGNFIPNWIDLLRFVKKVSAYVPMTPYLVMDIIPTDDGFSLLEINSHGQLGNSEPWYPSLKSPYIREVFHLAGNHMGVTEEKPVAIVLGGTKPHVDLIENLHMRGYYVILADYLDNPVAKPYADRHIQISTLDKESVLELAKNEKASLVIAACVDQANAVACYVSEKLGLPHPYSYETARNVTEKNRMKEIMRQNEIPTPNFLITDGKKPLNVNLRFPVVVKPVDANSSKGVKRVDNPDKLEDYVAEAMKFSREGLVVVEEFVDGKEIQVDCLAHNGSVSIIMTREKRKAAMGKDSELQSIGSRIPAVLSNELMKTIKDVAGKIATAFRLNNTPFFIQAIVKENEMNVLEFAPRVGGGVSHSILRKVASYDAVDAIVNSYMGCSITAPNSIGDSATYLTYLLYALPARYDHFKNVDCLIKENTIEEFYYTKTPGTLIGSEMSSGNRIGALLVRGNSEEELRKKNDRIRETLEAYDVEGNPILRKDLIQL